MTAAPVAAPTASASASRSPLVLVAMAGALFVIGAFFTNFALYTFLVGISPIPPLGWLIAAAGLALMCLFIPDSLRMVVRTPVVPWSIAFITIVVLSFLLWSSQSEIALEVTRQRILAGISISVFAILFAPPAALRIARWAVVVLTVATVPLEIYDLLHPHVLSVVVGRAAGFYVNPNLCGEALTLGVLFGHGVLRPRARALVAAIAGFGVLLTLSRADILLFAIVLLILARQGRLSLRGVFGGAVAVAGLIFILLAASGKLGALVDAVRFLSSKKNVIERVLNAQNAAEGGDASATLRIEVATRAVGMLSEHPFLGKGIGATNEWEYRIGPHNMYLLFGAEFGVLGLLLYPSMVFCVCWRARGPDRQLVWAIGAFYLLLGLFSHNVVDNWPDMVGLAMAVALLHPGVIAAPAELGAQPARG
jgi:O-antigen ligase